MNDRLRQRSERRSRGQERRGRPGEGADRPLESGQGWRGRCKGAKPGRPRLGRLGSKGHAQTHEQNCRPGARTQALRSPGHRGARRTQEAAPEGGDGGRARDGAGLGRVLPVGVHREAPSCAARGSAQLHVHHVHVREAGASSAVSLAGRPQPRPLPSAAHLRSATSTPITPSNPRLGAARAAAAMVLELRGAKGQSPRTGPS